MRAPILIGIYRPITTPAVDEHRGKAAMMQIEPAMLLTGGALAVAGVVWLVRLEGRINVGDQRFTDILSRLGRIENKLDKANGHSRRYEDDQ